MSFLGLEQTNIAIFVSIIKIYNYTQTVDRVVVLDVNEPVILLKYPTVHMSSLMRNPTICICEIKDEDQLRGNSDDDQRLFSLHG